jgi:hypothetical protein
MSQRLPTTVSPKTTAHWRDTSAQCPMKAVYRARFDFAVNSEKSEVRKTHSPPIFRT